MTEHEQLAEALREKRTAQLRAFAEQADATTMLWLDLPAYESPITGKWIHGRSARREDLKQSGSVEYDPGMKADAIRNHAANEAKLDKAIGESVERMINQLPNDKRRELEREATHYDRMNNGR